MKTINLAVSVRRFGDCDYTALCSFIEQWAASNGGKIEVCIDMHRFKNCYELNRGQNPSEILFLTVAYENYPTSGNYIIEINQYVKSACSLFHGVECAGINVA